MPVSTWLHPVVAGIAGLLIGSFLNVVIARAPIMMYRNWLREALESLREVDTQNPSSLWSMVFGSHRRPPAELAHSAQQGWLAVQDLPRLNLAQPASHCPACGHGIRWYQNIPLLSYLALRGRCAGCHQPYGWRYPAVELLCGLLFAWCGWRWGLSASGALWALFCATLLVLSVIDWQHTLLPDDIVLPLLWLGLLGAACGWTGTPLVQAVWGAIAGYLSLWSIGTLYRLLRGVTGMGHGDFKLLAALGAWLGWPSLLPVILLSSIMGLCAGIVFWLLRRLRPGGYFPFGPFLAAASLLLLLSPPSWTRAILP
jgi:leader peptidase (prepilin peptidase)/N-methyltransferase